MTLIDHLHAGPSSREIEAPFRNTDAAARAICIAGLKARGVGT